MLHTWMIAYYFNKAQVHPLSLELRNVWKETAIGESHSLVLPYPALDPILPRLSGE